MQKSIEDCYFFYYSTCSKNEACPFRHCEKALGNEIVCKNWLNKKCVDFNCPLRHMLITKNRAQILCYWESTPTGCQKPHCPFFHRLKPDESNLNSLSQSSTESVQLQTNQLQTHRLVVTNNNGPDVKLTSHSVAENESANIPIPTTNSSNSNSSIINSCVVSPLIVQMNKEDEESDSESLTNSINNNHHSKKTDETARNPKRDFKSIIDSNLTKPKVVTLKKTNVEEPELKVEVKTLDEIRKEKALLKNAEIENTSQNLDSKQLSDTLQTESSSDEVSRVEKRRMKFSDPTDLKPSKMIKTKSVEATRPLINEIKKTVATKQMETVVATVVAQVQTTVTTDVKNLKIKTLEEIKAEKELKKKKELELKQEIETPKSPPKITVKADDEKLKLVEPKEVKQDEVISNGTKTEILTTAQQSTQERTRKLKLIKKPKSEEKVNIVEEKTEKIEVPNVSDNKRKLDEVYEKPVEIQNIKPAVVEPINKIETNTTTTTTINKTKVNVQNENIDRNEKNTKKLKTLTNVPINESEKKDSLNGNLIKKPAQSIQKTQTIDNNNAVKSNSKTEHKISSSVKTKTDEVMQVTNKVTSSNNKEKIEKEKPKLKEEDNLVNEFDKEIDALMMLCDDEEIL